MVLGMKLMISLLHGNVGVCMKASEGAIGTSIIGLRQIILSILSMDMHYVVI